VANGTVSVMPSRAVPGKKDGAHERGDAETRRRKARDWHAKLDAVSLLFVALLFTVSLSFEKSAVT
jgi:hypothetical protein